MLDIGNNFIEKLENISHLSNLEELWVGATEVAVDVDTDTTAR